MKYSSLRDFQAIDMGDPDDEEDNFSLKSEGIQSKGINNEFDVLLERSCSPSVVKYCRENRILELSYYASGIFIFYLAYGFLQEILNRGDYEGERFAFPQALVLGKSCKPIPVMILGVLLARKKYPIAKYFCVLMIVSGVASFMYNNKKSEKASDHGFGYGELLLIVSLTLDGLTGVTQENMRSKYITNQHHMMYNVNLWSTIYLFAALLVTGQGFECGLFIYNHPQVIVHLLLFSLTSAFGQHFIFLTVVHFGPLTCSIITTTRKFFTILGSVLIFQNPMSSLQWFGAFLVFAGLGLDARFGKAIKTPQYVKVEPKS